MTRILVYILLLGIVLYLLWGWGRTHQGGASSGGDKPKPGGWFKAKRNPLEIWVQVYETASQDEGRRIQARLQEEDLECILYEQGKKSINGEELPGIGVSVPKSLMARAQNIISRMPL